MTENNTQSTKKAYYIVENAQGEKFLLPYFAETFRVLMDDKDTIRDMLNSLLGLDRDHEIIDLSYEYRSPYFKSLGKEERKYRFYELPETVSIWFCNFRILKSEDIFKDVWALYSEYDVKNSDATRAALPLLNKNRYIIFPRPRIRFL